MGKKPSSVQIDYDLFCDIFCFVAEHLDRDDPQCMKVWNGIGKKIDALTRHDLYSTYKKAETPEERDKARIAYLDRAGILESFRWSAESDANVMHRLTWSD